MSTCYDADAIHSMLDQALQSMSWRTQRKHLYCLALTRNDSQSHKAHLVFDGRIDCEVCGEGNRHAELQESRRQFDSDTTLHLTLVKPTKKARHAVTKQLNDKSGSGWYVPIPNAVALISTIPIRSKTTTPYSIEISETEREETFTNLLDLWWPDTGRMRRPGYQKDKDHDSEPQVALGTTNTRYEQNLEKVAIPFVSRGDTMEVATRWSDPDHEEALTRSNWKPPGNDIDWEPPKEQRGSETEAEESSG